METNFEGLIQLLAKSLYPEPDVFVRELIQNGHDSIVRRRELDRFVEGRIDIELDSVKRALLFRDNGIGMDRQDIKDFLSVIGSTGTGTARKQLQEEGRGAAYNLIGQFGIGMLSAFVVAEKVVVRTRKLNGKEAFAWHNYGSIDCELYRDDLPEVGSEIAVIIGPEYTYLLDEKRVREAIVKYCDFIPFRITLNGQGPVNVIDAPWHRDHWTSPAEKEATYQQFLNRRYPDVPLDVIPVEINEPFQARGALYITDRNTPGMNTTGTVEIFVRRMFVKSGEMNLLPVWAKFIRGVLDSPDLQPTAARDNIQSNHPSFAFFQKRLGEIIVDRLTYLAEKEPNKFRRINQWHHYHLKGMAHYYDEFFDRVGELLLFQTNKGEMSLQEYLGKNAPRPDREGKVPIYFFAYEGAAAQFYKLAEARNWVVINAGLAFEEELLEKYARLHHRTVHLERLDTTDDPQLFQRLDPGEEARFRQLELDLEGNLRRFGGLGTVSVRMRRFDPVTLPAVIIVTPETEAEQKLKNVVTQPWFMESLEDVAREAIEQSKQRPLYLQLNAANVLIQKLADMPESDRRGREVIEVMMGLYNSAILYSHNLLTRQNAEAMHGQFIRLLDALVKNRNTASELQKQLEEQRRQMLEYQRQRAETAEKRPDHVLIFMITPFSDEYRPLEEAVRRVFERPPYCFEVQLARDYTYTEGLLANVREHMSRAHGFIAEISDLNPNVMFELGAVMLPDDSRPIFSLRGRDAKAGVPADLREKLFVPYGSIQEPVERLESAIREAFERDGRIVHEGINQLLARRQKRFLSRTLLEGLRRTRLETNEIARVMGQYQTVEDLLESDTAEIGRKTGLEEFVIQAIQAELRGVVNG